MKEGLERTLRRLGEDAEEVMSTSKSAHHVLDNLVMELTPVVMAYKMKGTVPSVQALQTAAARLTAIVAATAQATIDKAELQKPPIEGIKP